MALGVAMVAGTVAVASVAAADEVILSNDFESGSFTPWASRGAATLAIANEGHESANSLAVTGRTADWNGPATSATALFDAGETYSVSAWAKLPAGTDGSAGIHFTVEGVPADGSDNTYTWVGGNIETTADTWVQLGGSYTLPAGLSSASLYVEAAGTTPFLVDDVLITGADDAPEVVTVSAVDFEDGTTGTWTQSGGATLTVVDDADGKVLELSNRVESFDGIQSPAGIFEPGVTHTFSARARLAPGGPASSGFRFVMKPDYTWIGNTTLTADTWTAVTGQFTVPADADPAAYQVYLEAAEATASYLVDDILITAPAADPSGPEPGIVAATGFEEGLDGWGPRAGDETPPTVGLSTDQAHGGTQSALVSARDGQGDGIGLDVSAVTQAGVVYDFTAWVRFAPGAATDAVWLSLAATTDSGTNYSTLAQFTGVTNSGWTQVAASFTMPAADSALLYLETNYNGTNTSDFYLDDVALEVPPPPVIEDLAGIHTTTDFPVGVAIDSRETAGPAAQLLTRHFNQITPENHMKPEAWYDAEGAFRPHDQAIALMDFARDNDLGLYGHVLVWHSQTPEWFFQNDAGVALTTSEADKQILRDRLRTHVFAIAADLSSRYGLFGSDTNPLYAWDVVNEVVSDSGEFADGLRRSEWYRILGESFIDLAFQYADEAFNDEYAVAGTDPVTLFINDYNTEQGGKQARYKALVERLLARGVPLDGVGHQFHVSLAMGVANLDTALDAFADLPVVQAVTEFDVTTGTPVTQASLIEQGYYFRDAFGVFREHAEDMFAVTVWGLTDGRSWRSGNGAPLIFNDQLKAKPAYYGAVNGTLPARLRTANVFAGDVAVAPGATESLEWSKLPLLPIESAGKFQLRWAPDHLTAFVAVADAAANAGDQVSFVLGSQTYTVSRDGTGDVPAVAAEGDGGYQIVAHIPLTGAAEGDTLNLDVKVTNDATTTGWNTPGAMGTLTLLEPLSYVEVVQARTAPVIDGVTDASWSDATTVTTAKQVSGTDGAIATVRTLWRDQTLYVHAAVADPVVDVSGSDPWIQDSVELYIDGGNFKNGAYRYDDMQVRINADNAVSFGTGDEGFQAGRLVSATARTGDGYVVEAAISLLEYGGPGTFHGLDFQVNDAADGARTSIRNWAEPEGTGYQTTSRWGVGRLVGPAGIVNLVQPDVIGTPVKGKVLKALPGTWSVSGATFTYQWQRDGVDIRRQTGLTYKLKQADVGHTVTVVVTAHAAGYDPVSAAADGVLVENKRRPWWWKQIC